MPDAVQVNQSQQSAQASPPSLLPILAIVWLTSLGTSVIWQGVFFIAREAYQFGKVENYLLAIVGGVTYVLGALTAGSVVRMLSRWRRGVSPRALLMSIMVILMGGCALAGFVQSPWSLWAFILLYAPLTGWMWPLVESYIASGRSGRGLVSAMGRFNIAWASAIPIGLWSMGPLLKHDPLIAFQILVVIHMLCLPLIGLLARAPADHGLPEVEDAEADMGKARTLLQSFRLLNSLSYVFVSLLLPALPLTMEAMNVPVAWRTPLLSIWVMVRVGMFIALERWHGWHGHWGTPIWSAVALGLGFTLVYIGSDPFTLGIGLAIFGVGAGGAYSGAIFYAMDVGKAEVDAGGKHEAILGSGYLVGPLIGLAIELLR